MKLDRSVLLPLITAALKEDIGSRDLTTSILIPRSQQAQGELVVREDGVIAGVQVAEWVFNVVDARIRFKPTLRDGQSVHEGKVVAYLEGPAQGILRAERTALNFLAKMSGIATLTRAFVDRVRRYKVQILDTRKTTPTLRLLEKYSVAVGGGIPHRMGLYDQLLIKDNHLQLIAHRLRARSTASGIPSDLYAVSSEHRISAVEEAVKQARLKLSKGTVVEVEVNNLQEFRQALSAQADVILLDNMKLLDIGEAVRLRHAVSRSKSSYKPLLEISGGVTLETVEKIAATGVDRISVGALTHSAPALNIALDLVG